MLSIEEKKELLQFLHMAEKEAYKALEDGSRAWFNYWVSVWVDINKECELNEPNPFEPFPWFAKLVPIKRGARRGVKIKVNWEELNAKRAKERRI